MSCWGLSDSSGDDPSLERLAVGGGYPGKGNLVAACPLYKSWYTFAAGIASAAYHKVEWPDPTVEPQ